MKHATSHQAPCIVYLHGFRSSPDSSKALLLRQWLHDAGVHYACPSLDISPRIALEQARAQIDGLMAQGLEPRLIGSSLGGFYASWFMEQHPMLERFKACLINPACYPSRDLAGQVGQLKAWHSDDWLEFKATDLDDLAEMAVGLSDQQRYLLVAAMGDELLDWQEMVAHYPGAQHHVVQGSDHGLSDFPDHWPTIKSFLLGD